MIRWNSNKAGFPGNSIHFIKSVFRQVFSVTSEAPEPDEPTCNLLALISTRAVNVDAPIITTVTNLAADIEEITNVLGIISTRVNNIDAEIDDSVTNLDAPIEC